MPGYPEITKKILARTAVVLLAFILVAAASSFSYTAASADAGPDLIVQNITLSPPEPAIDDSVTITVTVKNQGSALAASNHLVCYVDSTILGTVLVTPLAAGTMTTKAFTWKAEQGTHTIKATADSAGAVTETDETNNTNTFNLTTLAPDLIIQSISWSPENPSKGDNIVFTITIKNQGTSKARASDINLYIDGNSRGYQDISIIDPGSSITSTYHWVAPTGDHAIKAVVDENNRVNEGNETNNELTSTFSTLAPDLTIQVITWEPENPSKGDEVSFTVTIKNQGSGRADSCHLAYYIDDKYQSTLPVNSLETGASVNITFSCTAQDKIHEVKAIIDFYENLTESDENNNEKTASFLTLPPDLIVKDITWSPDNAAVGDTVTFSVTVKNQGSGRAEASHIDCYIGISYRDVLNIGALEADTEQTVTFQWQAVTGSHPVNAVADCDGILAETREDNNKMTKTIPIIPPDLIISNIAWSPENPATGDIVTFTVTLKNQGGGKAENFHVAYFIDDVLLTSNPVVNLGSGVSANKTCTWKSQTGLHTFKASVDYNNYVIESNENNNEHSVNIVPNMPDIAIGTITWTPADIPAGKEVTFSIDIENRGSLKAGPSRVTYYVDGAIVGYGDIGPLDAGAKVTEYFIWGATAGHHTIDIASDATNQILEFDETNNSKVVTLPPPDLVTEDVTWSPVNAAVGDTITFTATFRNQGSSKTQKAKATCNIDGLAVASADLPEIDIGIAITRTFDWVAEAGFHTVRITADSTNRVTETDETNNDKETKFATMTPDLTIQNISWLMENPLLSDDVTFIIAIKNQGSDTAVASQLTYSIDGAPDVFKDIKSISAGDTATLTFTLTLEAGLHTIDVAIDVNDDVDEIEETNNENTLSFSTTAPDLTVKTITWAPVTANPGDTITITAKIENRGKERAVNPRLALYVDGSPVDHVDISGIAMGSIATVEFSWTATAGLHEISVLADVDGLIVESNETNNEKSRTLTFEEPEVPGKKSPKLTTDSSANKGFLGGSWWIILLAAALLGGAAFVSVMKSLKKK